MSSLFAVIAFFVVVLSSRIARAEGPELRGFFEMGTGVRTVDPRGLTLKAAGESSREADESTAMVLRGSDVRPAPAGVMLIGGGAALGPVVVGVEVGLGLGGGASTKERVAGGIVVRPSGFLVAGSVGTFAGVVVDTKHVRYRFDAVLADEIVGYSMERVGSPETRVSAVNDERWTLGPRVHADFWNMDGIALGVSMSVDARHPTNAALMMVVTF